MTEDGQRWRAFAMAHPVDYAVAADEEGARRMAPFIRDLEHGYTSPGAQIRGLLTLDVGMSHERRPGIILPTDGSLFANSEFERCLHLSISEFTSSGPQRASSSERIAWEREVFTPDERRLLVRAFERGPVFHARLFLDAQLFAILPRGEVYDRSRKAPA